MNHRMSYLLMMALFSMHTAVSGDLEVGSVVRAIREEPRRLNICLRIMRPCLLIGAILGVGPAFLNLKSPDNSSHPDPIPAPCNKTYIDHVQFTTHFCNRTGCPIGFEGDAFLLDADADTEYVELQKRLPQICPDSPEIRITRSTDVYCHIVPPFEPVKTVLDKIEARCRAKSLREERLEKYNAVLTLFKEARNKTSTH